MILKKTEHNIMVCLLNQLLPGTLIYIPAVTKGPLLAPTPPEYYEEITKSLNIEYILTSIKMFK